MHFSTSAVLLVSSLLSGAAVSAFSDYNSGSSNLYARYAEPEPYGGLDSRSAYAYPEDDDFSIFARDAEPEEEHVLEARDAFVDDILDALYRRDVYVREAGLKDLLKKGKDKITGKKQPSQPSQPNYSSDVQNALDAFGKKDRSKTDDLNAYINEQQDKHKASSRKTSRKGGKRSVDDEFDMLY